MTGISAESGYRTIVGCFQASEHRWHSRRIQDCHYVNLICKRKVSARFSLRISAASSIHDIQQANIA
jgi:hypothetical protein